MKHLFLLLITFATIGVKGQTKKDSLPDLYAGRETTHDSLITFGSPQILSQIQDSQRKIMFFGKEIKTPALEIRGNGDVYYNPIYFSECDARDTLIFLYNFLKILPELELKKKVQRICFGEGPIFVEDKPIFIWNTIKSNFQNP